MVASLGMMATFNPMTKGITVLMAIHDLHLASRFDRVILLREGKILNDDRPDVVLTREGIQKAFDIDLTITAHEG